MRHRFLALPSSNVGIKQVSERIWLVSFMDYDLGYFDDETCRLESLDNPFGPKLARELFVWQSCRANSLVINRTHSIQETKPRVYPEAVIQFRRAVMTIEGLIVWLVIGAIAGWLAGLIMKGYGFGLVGNIVVGIVGAIIAGWLLPRVGIIIVGGIVAEIINAVIGAVILLLIIGFVKKA